MTDEKTAAATASEMLRRAADDEPVADDSGNLWHSEHPKLMAALGWQPALYGPSWTKTFLALADVIDAELAEAREASLREGAAIWAKANGWPDLKDGEGFGEWLQRCAVPLPRFEDGEPVQVGDVAAWGTVEDVAVSGSAASWGDWLLRMEEDVGPMEGTFSQRVERPEPAPLAADGLPIREGDTVYLTDGRAHLAGLYRHDGGEDDYGLVGIGPDDPLTVGDPHYPMPGGEFVMLREDEAWCPASWLTHDEPDTQGKIDGDVRKDAIDYWGCRGVYCDDCPAKIDGKRPNNHYGTTLCDTACVLDLLRRQRAVCLRRGGE